VQLRKNRYRIEKQGDIMAATNQTEALKERKKSLECQKQDIRRNVKARDDKRFKEAGGCNTCSGRGWIVIWDTLDSMSGCYAEYADCSNESCTHETRERSGLLPRNSKYDRNRCTQWFPNYTEDETTTLRELHEKIEMLEREISLENSRWFPTKGKLVKVVKEGRGRKDRRVPVGVQGIVLNCFTNNWGTSKVIVLDKHGQKHFPATSYVEVIDPDPKDKVWTELLSADRKASGIPVIGTIKAKSHSAALVRLTNSREFWVPLSQAPELKNAKRNETTSIILPLWLAKKNGITN